MANSKSYKINVEQFVYEKVKKLDVEVSIPTEPIFFQESNHRIVTGLFPQFATWADSNERLMYDNAVWVIKIIQIREDKIIQTDVGTRELSDIISRFEMKPKSETDYLIDEVVVYLRDFFTDDRISKETFVNKFNEQLAKIKKIIEI